MGVRVRCLVLVRVWARLDNSRGVPSRVSSRKEECMRRIVPVRGLLIRNCLVTAVPAQVRLRSNLSLLRLPRVLPRRSECLFVHDLCLPQLNIALAHSLFDAFMPSFLCPPFLLSYVNIMTDPIHYIP